MASRRITTVIIAALVLLLVACGGKPRTRTDSRQDGTPWRSGSLARGKQSGVWTYWYPGGQQQASGRFVNDKQDDRWTWWYPNGQMQSTGSYAGKGQRVGEWAHWHESGKRQAQGAYGNAVTAAVKPGEGRADRQHGLWRYWRADGTPAVSGWFVNGSRMLVWTYLAADGTLAEQGAYWNGAKIGWWRERKDGAETWVDHGCPAGYECYREPSTGTPRRWGMLKDQRPTGIWIVYGADGAPRYADLTDGEIVEWMAWRDDGSLLGAGRRGAAPIEQYFTPAGLTMVATAGDAARTEAQAVVAASERLARAELVTTVAPGPVASSAPAVKPAAVAELSLAPMAILPGRWTPAEEGSAADLVASYTSTAARATSSYDWEPVTSARQELLTRMLPQTRLLAADGEVIDLADFRGKEKVVLVILRGFSGQVCLYCTAQSAALLDSLPRFASAGARVVLLYPGPAESVPQFIQAVQSLGRTVPKDLIVAIDPDLALVRALAIEDALAKPTSIILDRQGAVAWTYVGADMTDRPAVDTLLREVSRLP